MRRNRIIAIAFSAVLVLQGCHKRVPILALPPAAAPNPEAVAFDEAERAFNAGNYDEASREYENYLRLNPIGTERDQALFRLGLACALRPAADWQRASSALREIVEGFPNSPFRPPANLILSLHSELDQQNATAQQRDQRIRQLTAELDRLKKIDAGRRKRP
jgi:outer membrane protein assembly factor BamD (BamD/ComL family)